MPVSDPKFENESISLNGEDLARLQQKAQSLRLHSLTPPERSAFVSNLRDGLKSINELNATATNWLASLEQIEAISTSSADECSLSNVLTLQPSVSFDREVQRTLKALRAKSFILYLTGLHQPSPDWGHWICQLFTSNRQSWEQIRSFDLLDSNVIMELAGTKLSGTESDHPKVAD